MKVISRLYVALIILFLYAPVAVMVFFSFNSGSSVWVFESFSKHLLALQKESVHLHKGLPPLHP